MNDAIVIPVRSLRRIFVGLVVLILLLLLVLVVRTQLFRAGVATLFDPGAAEVLDHNAYQAVFLAGGQVFFGKLQQQGTEYFLLYDVYYLAGPDEANPQGQLIKRGTELHAPVEPLIIPAREILFIENLKPDGQVASAIRRFKSGEAPITTPPPVTNAPTSSPTPRPSATR